MNIAGIFPAALTTMKLKRKNKNSLALFDMDIGLFLSYELTAQSLSTKLFRIITLSSIPLNDVMDLRMARDEEITKVMRLNWLHFLPNRRPLCPLYTLQVSETSPRIFMRLDQGSHIAMKNTLKG